MGKWPYKLKHCVRRVQHQHEEHMEYGGMLKGMVNSYGKHHWYLGMWFMPKWKRGGNSVMLEAL